MAYRFKPTRPLAAEVRQIAARQLDLAMSLLRGIGDHALDEAVHEARRHVKKVRALLQLVRSPLGPAFKRADPLLKEAIVTIATIADGEELVDEVDERGRSWMAGMPAATRAVLRRTLADHEMRIDRRATANGALPRTATLLDSVRRQSGGWRLRESGFRAVRPGLLRSMRRTRKSASRARRDPTTAHLRKWRARVKTLWLQLRLLERTCGNGISADVHRLEELDGLLGRYHNLVLLEQVVAAESLLSLTAAADVRGRLRGQQNEIRRRAFELAAEALGERPADFAGRLARLWASERRRRGAPNRRTRWTKVA